MMFTPCWPSAGPTGGDGFAAPAGHWTLTIATTFFATARALPLRLLYVLEVQPDRGLASENRDHHLHLLALGPHLAHRSREVGERSARDPDVVAVLERHLGLRALALRLPE